MIVITQPLWDPWPDPVNQVNETITIMEDATIRTSALLGPDGEPLIIRTPKRKIGFDLSPKR